MSSGQKTVLQIDASARHDGSVTRELTSAVVKGMLTKTPDLKVLVRDVSSGLPFLDDKWVAANLTDPSDRTAEQKMALALSDTLVRELKAADTLVIGAPIYNFSVPAALKAWMDLVARARETFRYTEEGPKGLLVGKKAIVAVASGGVKAGSDVDYATNFIVHFLGFLGIEDVTIVAADQLMMTSENRDAALAQATGLAA